MICWLRYSIPVAIEGCCFDFLGIGLEYCRCWPSGPIFPTVVIICWDRVTSAIAVYCSRFYIAGRRIGIESCFHNHLPICTSSCNSELFSTAPFFEANLAAWNSRQRSLTTHNPRPDVSGGQKSTFMFRTSPYSLALWIVLVRTRYFANYLSRSYFPLLKIIPIIPAHCTCYIMIRIMLHITWATDEFTLFRRTAYQKNL